MALKKMVSEESVIPETIQGQTIKIATIADKEIVTPDINADIQGIKDDVAEISSDLNLTKSDVGDNKSDIDTISADVSIVKSNVSTLSSNLLTTQNEVADNTRDISETKSKVNTISSDLNTTKNDVAGIKSKIPNAASTTNQLADKDFVNSSINNYAAFYLTKDSSGNAFGSYAELSSATQFYNAGVERTPTKNDYLVILEDETKTTPLGINPTTRYTYQGIYPDGQWEYQYIVNNTSLTQAQVNAINSGVTKDIVDTRVIPSTEYNGYAANAVNAINAQNAVNAQNAQNAANSDTATYADEAGYSTNSGYATNADNATYAQTADIATTATYAPDYTPLSTFNSTLGDLSSIIQGI